MEEYMKEFAASKCDYKVLTLHLAKAIAIAFVDHKGDHLPWQTC